MLHEHQSMSDWAWTRISPSFYGVSQSSTVCREGQGFMRIDVIGLAIMGEPMCLDLVRRAES
jgi:hypothetical protein